MEEEINNVENLNADYDVCSRNDRLKRKRSTTDVACLAIYGMFIITWIGIAIYAFSHSTVSPFRTLGLILKSVWAGLFYSPAIFFFNWFCILLIVFYFIMLRWWTKFTVYLTITLEFIFISLPLIAIGFELYSTATIPVVLFSYTFFMIEIQILKKVGVDFVCKIILDTCKAISAFPSSVLIAFFSLCSTASFCLFVASVIDCLVMIRHNYGDTFNLIITFSIISGWILLVHSLCTLSTLHGIFTSWCRMSNKKIIPNWTIPRRHLFYAYRYHIGSFAFMSLPIVPIIQIIRTICANVQSLKMKFKESPYNIYCFLVIIVDLLTNTSVMCASYGKCLYPSMNDAFKVLIHDPMKFTAARLAINAMILFGMILIPGIVIGMMELHIVIWNIHLYHTYLIVISSTSIIITFEVLFIFSAAIDSVLFCYLEKLSKGEKSADHGNDQIV